MGRLTDGVKQRVSTMSIKQKIMLSLLAVAVFSILIVGMVSLGLSRWIVVDNSNQFMTDILDQISVSVEQRIISFEDTSYNILLQTNLRNQLFESAARSLEKQDREIALSDAINRFPILNRYIRYAIVTNQFGETYTYQSYNQMETARSGESLLVNQAAVLRQIDKAAPLKWLLVDGELCFARCIIDESDFSILGTACFVLSDSFLSFLEGDRLLSDYHLIIANRQNEILSQGMQNLTHPDYQRLLASETDLLALEPGDNHGILVVKNTTPELGWRILCFVRTAELYSRDRLIILLDVLTILLAALMAGWLTVAIARNITKNITKMDVCMTAVEEGDFNARMRPGNYDEVGRLGLRLNYMIKTMETMIDRLAVEKSSKEKAEFRALQAQINPHFLYNTLGSIKWVANRRQEKELESMLDALINLLKGSIRKSSSYQTVAEEIAYIEHYVTLQKMRYGEAFQVRYELEPDVMDALIPGFLLQPLVENAIYHGIDVAEGNGIITIRGSLKNGSLLLAVEDNGVGLTQEKCYEILHNPKQYKGFNSIGISLVNERLRACYGDASHFDIHSQLRRGTHVEILIPFSIHA